MTGVPARALLSALGASQTLAAPTWTTQRGRRVVHPGADSASSVTWFFLSLWHEMSPKLPFPP